MAEQFEFEIVFALPGSAHDPIEISNAVFEAGFEDAIVGTGIAGLVAVELEAEGEDAETVILKSARALIHVLPAGTRLREVRPDLVSLADVAKKIEVKRQALQQREMPLPSLGGMYRIDEIEVFLTEGEIKKPGRRRARYNIENARNWLRSGRAARIVNAKLTTSEIDPVSLEYRMADAGKGQKIAS